MGVWGLRLWRAAPGGGAGWSECQRPWGRGARLRGWRLPRLGGKRVLGSRVGLRTEGTGPGGSGVGEGRGGAAGGAWGAFGKEPCSVHICPYFPFGMLVLVLSNLLT